MVKSRKPRPKTPHRARPAQPVKPTAKPKSKHTGPETRYDPTKLPDVVKALEAGQTQATIAGRIFGVRPEQLSRWKAQHPQLTQSIEEGEKRYWEAACDNVERVVVASASGRVPKTVNEVRDEQGRLTGERVIEYHAPSVAAGVFALCNKRPGQWKNVQRVEVQHDGQGPRPLVFVIDNGGGQDRRVAVGGGVVEALPEGEAPKALEAETSNGGNDNAEGDDNR